MNKKKSRNYWSNIDNVKDLCQQIYINKSFQTLDEFYTITTIYFIIIEILYIYHIHLRALLEIASLLNFSSHVTELPDPFILFK